MLAMTAGHSLKECQGSDDHLSAIQRLRYEVYCLERKFRDAADCPDGLEQDEYDPHSIHIYATDDRDAMAGTVRLVRHSPLGLPIQQHGTVSIPAWDIPRGEWAEISRLIVARGVRRQPVQEPLVLWGLFARMFEEGRRVGITCVVAAMEEALWRLLRRFGFPFTQIGPPIEYFGRVVPYAATLDSLEPGVGRIRAFQRHMARTHPELVEKFHLSVAA